MPTVCTSVICMHVYMLGQNFHLQKHIKTLLCNSGYTVESFDKSEGSSEKSQSDAISPSYDDELKKSHADRVREQGKQLEEVKAQVHVYLGMCNACVCMFIYIYIYIYM